MLTIIIFLLIFRVYIIYKFVTYIIPKYLFERQTYYQVTHNSFLSTKSDKGRYGEYLIYKQLKGYEKTGGKFLFNCYLPRENGKTTEIDVLLINEDGIFVFESKNYGGWIFGNEKSKDWTQTLPEGKGKFHKEYFFNPIMQNKLHIKWLRNIVGENVPIYSIVVFSERCTLKEIEMQSQDVQVVKRNALKSKVISLGKLQVKKINNTEVSRLYGKLYHFTQVTSEQKMQHIEDINRKYDSINSDGNPKSEEVKKEDKVKPDNSFVMPDLLKSTGCLDVCPKCGGILILRTARKGENAGSQFYGCSNFPKCRYVQGI